MKSLSFLVLLFFFGALYAAAQTIAPAPEGKSVVYFVRPSSMGFAINFSYFDSTKLIGRFNGPAYIRYECDPGKHLFWARSENRSFVEAELEPGKIYFLEAIPKMGAMKAAVELALVDLKDLKAMGKIKKMMAKKPSESFTSQQLADEQAKLGDVIEKGLAKYDEDKKKGKGGAQLKREMYYEGE